MATTLSPNSERSLHELRSTPALPHASNPSFRLPSVSVPRADYLQPQGFNPNRRISITDPFLHAYPAVHEGSQASSSSDLFPGSAPPNLRRGSNDEASMLLSAPIKSEGGGPSLDPARGLHGHPNDGGASRYAGGPSAGYEFGASFGGQGQGGPGPYQPPPGAGYRFGGPQQSGSQQDGSSHFDYSMRRHSLTNAGQSPPRLPSIDSSPGGKRKSSGEEAIREDGYSYAPNQNEYPPPHLSSAPFPKRRNSGTNYDKMGTPGQGEQRRRESMLIAGAPGGMAVGWEEDRRGSSGSYGGAGGGGYAMGYGPPPSADPYDQRGMPSPGYSSLSAPPRYPSDYDPQLQHQGQQPVGPRGSVPMRPPPHHLESDMSNYGTRRPSNALGNGQPSLYSNYSNSRGPPPQQSSMLPTVTHSPPDHQNAAPSPPASSHPPQPSRARPPSASYSNLPPAQAAWERAGPLPPTLHGQSHAHTAHSRQASSAILLDPSTAYGAGGSKDTPYSRSPELRVSHKLAERKRRKEMAQLFDELRESLPVERGLKSSKWEILSKAVEYIITLKEHNLELSRDNTLLRDHFGLGPGPQPHASPLSPSYASPKAHSPHPVTKPPQAHPAEQWQASSETWGRERGFEERAEERSSAGSEEGE